MTTERAAPAINAWHVAQQQFDNAAERLNLDPGLRQVLREPRRDGGGKRAAGAMRVLAFNAADGEAAVEFLDAAP